MQRQQTSRQQPARPGTSFAARFGRAILQHGIAPLPSALYHYQAALGLSAQQVWFVSYILAHKWDADLPYPSLKKMAARTGLSLRQLQRIKSSLCETGDLVVEGRYELHGGQEANTYDFAGLFARLEAVLTTAPTPFNPIQATEEGGQTEAVEGDTSFVARYGRVIARYGVAAVPWAVFTHQAVLGLTPQQVWFIAYIFSFQWDTNLPYPSLRRMAEATGYSTVQLHAIKAELVVAGHLRLVHRRSADGGQDANAYDFSALLETIAAQVQTRSEETSRPAPILAPPAPRLPPRRGRRARPMPGDGATLSVGDDTRLTRGGDSPLPGKSDADITTGDDTQLTGRDDGQLTGTDDKILTGGDDTCLPAGDNRKAGGGMTRRYPGGMTVAYPNIEAPHTESLEKEDSNPRALAIAANNNGDRPPYSPYIAAVILDFSQELGDVLHAPANVTQALRLFAAEGGSEELFVSQLYAARQRTRLAQGRHGQGRIVNKMAYFFTVLQQLSAPVAGSVAAGD